ARKGKPLPRFWLPLPSSLLSVRSLLHGKRALLKGRPLRADVATSVQDRPFSFVHLRCMPLCYLPQILVGLGPFLGHSPSVMGANKCPPPGDGASKDRAEQRPQVYPSQPHGELSCALLSCSFTAVDLLGSRDGSGVGFSLRRLIFGSLCKVKKTEVRRIWCLQVAEKGRRPASPCGGGLGTAQAQHNKGDRLPLVVVVWSRNLQPRLHANRAGGLPCFGGDVAREGDDGPRVSIGKD
ncbi:hypothetical protein Taro_053198, partial [Colocasia esculenta]|nr:hypothetical protein [Colocasia esculenta]